jgi:hypothetical protein
VFVQHFDRDFDAIVEAQEPFALVRFHDGEHAILDGIPYSAASNWTVVGGKVWLREELLQVLTKPPLDRFFIGLSPPCCAPRAAHFYRRNMPMNRALVTYATIFSNRNYRRVPRLRARFSDAVIVSSGNGDIQVPTNGVSQPWDMDLVVEQLLSVDKPIFVAAGPCANLIIHRYWARQEPSKRQFIIDVGAAIDSFVHGKKTRYYHQVKSKALYHECKWDDWKPFGPVSQELRDTSERMARQVEAFRTADLPKRPSKHKRSGYSGTTSTLVSPSPKRKVLKPTRIVPRVVGLKVVKKKGMR